MNRPLLAAEEAIVRFGVIPLLNSIELTERFSPLLHQLEQALGQPVRLEVPADFRTLVERVGKQEIDIAYLGPVPYLQLTEQYGPHPILAMEELKGSKHYHGVIFVRGDSPIRELGDLVGKRFAFGDPGSTMNHTLPMQMLTQAGVSLTDLAEHAFVGNNQNVVLSVLMGQFDAAGVKEDIYNQYADRGMRVIAESLPVPNLHFVAGRHQSAAWVEKVRATMLDLHKSPEGMAALKSFHPDATALVPAEDEAFESLRQLLKKK
ncbi:MAG: phosphate/phosphite/phosphonate ABC transporter substrate-binding protein [Magnetococcales bacterium]|nr:phosphate/phosphite/phosphonate ABC transporter substrate-binding protein [Magnetococcales bacterium]